MNRYVLGFMWHQGDVLLLQKSGTSKMHPNMLNGIGGRIEAPETAEQAMRREFLEEAGFALTEGDWTHFGQMSGDGWNVELFAAELDEDGGRPSDGYATDEGVTAWKPGFEMTNGAHPWMVPNLQWLVPLSEAAAKAFVERVNIVESF